MASPVYRLLTSQLPVLDLGGRIGRQLLADLNDWDFDPNELVTEPMGNSQGPSVSLLQGLVQQLPHSLSGNNGEFAVAQDLVSLLIKRGADPSIVDLQGRHLEDLGPPALRTFLMVSRGGDVHADAERQRLLRMAKESMRRSRPVERLKDESSYESDWQPVLRGAPVPVGLLAAYRRWFISGLENENGSISSSAGAVAQKRGRHVQQLARWAMQDQEGDARHAALAVAWCVAAVGKRESDKSAAVAWAETGAKLEAFSSTLSESANETGFTSLLQGARAAVNGRYGALTSDVALVVAEGLTECRGWQVTQVWVQAVTAAVTPGVLRTLSWFWGDSPRSAQVSCELRSVIDRRVKLGPPEDRADAEAWLSGWPLSLGTAVFAEVLVKAPRHGDAAQVNQWWVLAKEWLDLHPEQRQALVERIQVSITASNADPSHPNTLARARALALEAELGTPALSRNASRTTFRL